MGLRMPYLAWLLGALLGTVGMAGEPLRPLADPPLAPDFELEDMAGRTHTMSDYRGKVLLINFWASWCPPCVKEMPSLQRAWEQVRGEGIQVLGVNAGETREAIEGFTQRYPVAFPILMDREVRMAADWRVKGLPTTCIVDTEGRIVFRVLGERAWDDPAIVAQVRALAEGSAK